mmetsp:Transcript_24582/g.48862  ORF Transcript_24582/g.48862 Transcript_24582/m.48862 type:complete len:425 (+) Transcript_24582:50-1324(+)
MPPTQTTSELVRSFYVDGYCTVPAALSAACVESFVHSISEDLEKQGVKLSDKRTWPLGNKNRVMESAPPGDCDFWSELLESKPLADALDEIVGRGGSWELNSNPLLGSTGPRHWYCPVTFPEQGDQGDRGEGDEGDEPHAAPLHEKGRPAKFYPCARDVEMNGPVLSPSRWQPVNRRRFLNSGWHIDVGPGFPNSGPRTSTGSPLQGPVILALLSDCPAGHGGTAFVKGSHFPVLSEIMSSGPSGVPHDTLNTLFARRMRSMTESGAVLIDPPKLLPPSPSSVHVTQATGLAGDVLLLHPLVIHSGTTNCGAGTVRIMANGMARTPSGARSSQALDNIYSRTLEFSPPQLHPGFYATPSGPDPRLVGVQDREALRSRRREELEARRAERQAIKREKEERRRSRGGAGGRRPSVSASTLVGSIGA